jgi:hypothetical protein
MKLQVSLSEAEKLLIYKADGYIDLPAVKKICSDVFFLASQHATRKNLLDLRETDTDLTTAQFFQIIKYVGEIGMDHSHKVAIVYTLTEKDQWNLSFFETAAVEHGYQIRLFTTVDAALNWLHTDAKHPIATPAPLYHAVAAMV